MATTTPTHAQRRRADARTIRALRAALDLTTRQLALYALTGHEASCDIIAANRVLLLKTGSRTILPMKTLGKSKPRQKFEYRVEHAKCGGMGTNALNALGVEGWELCATIATPDTPSDLSSAWPAVVIYIFKRPV